jgi:hypothetical protein
MMIGVGISKDQEVISLPAVWNEVGMIICANVPHEPSPKKIAHTTHNENCRVSFLAMILWCQKPDGVAPV